MCVLFGVARMSDRSMHRNCYWIIDTYQDGSFTASVGVMPDIRYPWQQGEAELLVTATFISPWQQRMLRGVYGMAIADSPADLMVMGIST